MHEREREAFYILCPASSLMDVPRYVNPDKLMNVPIAKETLPVTVVLQWFTLSVRVSQGPTVICIPRFL